MRLIGTWAFNVLTSSEIVSLPLFILMGELLFRTRLSQSLFSGLAPWMWFLPGRLLHTTVLGCSLFAAISGSSAATTQVVGRITLTRADAPRLRQGHRGRQPRRRRHARLPDPAVDPDDHLRGAGGGIAAAAVHRGLPAGLRAGRLLHGLHGGARRAAAVAGARTRPPHVGLGLGRPVEEPDRARPGRVPDLHRARHDVSRHRQPVRGGGDRRAGRARGVGVAAHADLRLACAMPASAPCRPPA